VNQISLAVVKELAGIENFLKSIHSTQFRYKRGGDTKSH